LHYAIIAKAVNRERLRQRTKPHDGINAARILMPTELILETGIVHLP
jgi:hypothetical protein